MDGCHLHRWLDARYGCHLHVASPPFFCCSSRPMPQTWPMADLRSATYAGCFLLLAPCIFMHFLWTSWKSLLKSLTSDIDLILQSAVCNHSFPSAFHDFRSDFRSDFNSFIIWCLQIMWIHWFHHDFFHLLQSQRTWITEGKITSTDYCELMQSPCCRVGKKIQGPNCFLYGKLNRNHKENCFFHVFSYKKYILKWMEIITRIVF